MQTPTTQTPPTLITAEEAAARLGMHPASLRKLIIAGAIVGQRWGRDWQVDAASVAAYQPATNKGQPRKGRPILPPQTP